MIGWLIKTFCALYFQIYDFIFSKAIDIFFPLISLGKSSAVLLKKYIYLKFRKFLFFL